MKVITESEMNFGTFDDADIFHIENSGIYKELGTGIRTVEFVLRYREDSIIFLEAKKSCPNAANRYESEKKEQDFENYYSSIIEKFEDSLQVYLMAIMGKCGDISEIGARLKNVSSLEKIQLKFILVIKNVGDISWLAGPLAELKARLLKVRKLWKVEVAVLSEELAEEYGLISREPM